jgi:hypothetical protein
MSTAPVYPVRVEGRLDPQLSRWLWLVKWLLAIPHFVVLAFLWIAFAVLSVVAFFAILFTGRYPHAIFDFNLGVLRWTWRVAFYATSALGTDRYPPFSLAERRDYPATLDVPYPDHLSRGLVLVKWWLLAIPHYLIVGVFAGGGWWAASEAGDWWWGGGGLVTLLVLIAAIGLLFTGRYPRGLFDLVLGLDRWVIRVAAYAGLMTDAYPPFRLDLGGSDPGTVSLEEPVGPAEPQAPTAAGGRWSAGRILLVVLGSIAGLVALGLLAAGAAGIVIDQTQREDGFVTSPTERLATGSYAIVSESVDVELDGPDWATRDLIGTIRITSDSERPVFVGIAREPEAAAYLASFRRAVVTDLWGEPNRYDPQGAGAPATPPAEQSFWAASTSGTGKQTLDWELEDGTWTVVAMNADGSAGVVSEVSVGAELDALLWIAVGVLAAGLAVLALAAGLVYLAIPKRRA